MAKERLIKTKMWSDDYFQELSPEDKLLFIYLITNEHTELCGVYELSFRTMAFETGLSIDRVSRGMDRLSQSGKVFYVDGYVIVMNFTKSQHTESDKIQKGVKNSIGRLPDHLREIYPMDSIYIEYDKLKLKLKLKSEPKESPLEITADAVDIKVEYGNRDINKMLEALKGKIGISAFADSSIERNIASHCVNLMGKIGVEEFRRRLDIILNDDFKHKNCNSIRYVYNQIKGFIEPKSKGLGAFIS